MQCLREHITIWKPQKTKVYTLIEGQTLVPGILRRTLNIVETLQHWYSLMTIKSHIIELEKEMLTS